MRTSIRRAKLHEVAEYLRTLAQNDYMGASGGFFSPGTALNEHAETLDMLAESLEDAEA